MNSTTFHRPLPLFLSDLLAAPPRHGEGVNPWLYRMARQLHAHRSELEICAMLAVAVSDCGRDVTTEEIARAVRRSKMTAWVPQTAGARRETPSKPKWPPLNAEQREAVLREMDGFGLVDLWAASPVRWDDTEVHTNEILQTIFPPNCLLCAGSTKADARTAPLSHWVTEGMPRLQFVVPSPMRALTGVNQEGRESARCLDNTGPRRFLVVEFDNGAVDEQAAILRWLALRVPLTLAVFSGKKSLHGWFCCAGASKEKLEGFFSLACTLGADSMMWTRCQLTRMPDGTREGGARQTVYFFNPATCR